jgi:hypothetical protein
MADTELSKALAAAGLSEDEFAAIDDQIRALQGLPPRVKQDEGLDLFQPVRTALSYTGNVGGQVARGLGGEQLYQEAKAAREQELGITPDSPWYESAEALPTLGDVITQSFSPEFKASGVGRIVTPVTNIVGAAVGDPTSYIAGIAKGVSGVAARAAGAGALMEDATAANKLRAALVTAGELAPEVAAKQAEKDAALIVQHVMTKGTPAQQAMYKAGGFLREAEPLALTAPAALAYGPQTIAAAYEQAKGIPESETPIADAASAALLGGLSVMMGKGLLDAGSALSTWQKHAADKGLAQAVVDQGDQQIAAAAAETGFALQPGPTDTAMQLPLFEGARPTPLAAAAAEAAPPTGPLPGQLGLGDVEARGQLEPVTTARQEAPVAEVPPAAVEAPVQVSPESTIPERPVEPPAAEVPAPAPEPPVAPAAPAAAEAAVPVEAPVPPPAERPVTPGPSGDLTAIDPYRVQIRQLQGEEARLIQELQSDTISPNREEVVSARLDEIDAEIKRLQGVTEGAPVEAPPSTLAVEPTREPVKAPPPAVAETGAMSLETKEVPAAVETSAIPEPSKAPENVPAEGAGPVPRPAPATPTTETPTQPPAPPAKPPVEVPAEKAKPLTPKEQTNWATLKRVVASVKDDIIPLDEEMRDSDGNLMPKAKREEHRRGIIEQFKKMVEDAGDDPEKIRALQRFSKDERGIPLDLEKSPRVDRWFKRLVEGKGTEQRRSQTADVGDLVRPGNAPGWEARGQAGTEKAPTRIEQAVNTLRKQGTTIREFFDSPEQEWKFEYGGKKWNLRDKNTAAGKVWAKYVELLDQGLSPADARKTVAQLAKEGKLGIPAAKSIDQQIRNAFNAGFSHFADTVERKFGVKLTDEEAIPTDAAKLGVYKMREGNANKMATALSDDVTKLGDRFEIGEKKFKAQLEKTLAEYGSAYEVGVEGGVKSRSKEVKPLFDLAEKLGVPRSVMYTADGKVKGNVPDIIREIADRAGIETPDYRERVAAKRKQTVSEGIHVFDNAFRTEDGKLRPSSEIGFRVLDRETADGRRIQRIEVDKFTNEEALARQIAGNPNVTEVVLPELKQFATPAERKAQAARGRKFDEALAAHGVALDFETNPDSNVIPVVRAAGMADRAFDIQIGHIDLKPYGYPEGTVSDTRRWARGMDRATLFKAVDTLKTTLWKRDVAMQLRAAGLDVDMGRFLTMFRPSDQPAAAGTFHGVYPVPGVTTKDGAGVVIRLGAAPHIPMPEGPQRALMAPTLAKGMINTGDNVAFWGIHPAAHVAEELYLDAFRYFDESGEFTKAVREYSDLQPPAQRYDANGDPIPYLPVADPAKVRQLQETLETSGHIPPGASIRDILDASAELLRKSKEAGIMSQDMGGVEYNSQYFRWDQVGIWPVKAAAKDAVTFKVGDQLYQMGYIDYGAVHPDPTRPATAAHPFWNQAGIEDFLGLMKARVTDNAPDSRLTYNQVIQRLRQYDDDLAEAVNLGETDLKLVNHDRAMLQSYLDTYAALGERPAQAVADIHGRLLDALAKVDGPLGRLASRFEGFTASPQLAGLYHQVGDSRRLFVNLVEAVNASRDKEGAIDNLLYALFHEVAHERATGHGPHFDDMEGYIKALVESQKLMDDFRGTLRQALSDTDYKRIQDELVPEFNKRRAEYGSYGQIRGEAALPVPYTESVRRGNGTVGESAQGAEAAGGLPTGRAASSTEAVQNRPRTGAAGAQGNLVRGVQPGEAVPRGAAGQTGQLRTAAAAGGTPTQRRSPRGTAGLGDWDGTAAGQAALEKRVETLFARDKPPDIEGAKKLISDLQEKNLRDSKPVGEVHQRAWDLARELVDHFTDDERAIIGTEKRLPFPRKSDQVEGLINMMHYLDLDDTTRARMAVYYELTKGLHDRDTVRPWADVDDNVKELLGLHSPDEYLKLYQSRAGAGLKDKDVLMLRYLFNEFSTKIRESENRLYELVNKDPNPSPELVAKLRKDISFNERQMQHSALILSKGLTGTARALAIAKHDIRALDPQLRMDQDMRAGLRERMRTRFKDAGVAEGKVTELMDMFHKIRADKDGDWGEFYRAYRAMLGSKLWPDKILEFYKAGLLGWPSRVANLTSNSLFRGVRYLEDTVAGALDAAGSKLTGEARSRYVGEAGVSLSAMRRAVNEAYKPWLRAQGDAFALREMDVMDALAKGGIMEDLLQHPGAIEGKIGEFIRFPFKGLSADDAMAKHISRVDTMYREIYRRLRSGEYTHSPGESLGAATERIYDSMQGNFKNALDGKQFDSGQLRKWQQLAEEAEKTASIDTFQQDLGVFGRGTNWLLRSFPAAQVIFPFMRTPANIARETLKRTPLGLLGVAKKWKELTPGQRYTEMSKPLMGTMIGAGIMSMAMNGEVTGGGPVDPDEVETLKATGWQPYSIKVGDQWVSYQRFEPLAAVAGIAADAAEALRNGDFQNWKTGSMKVLQSAAENVTNKTFLSGLDGMFSAVSHPQQYLDRFIKQMQGSIIPNSLGMIPVSGITRALDPTYRRTEALDMSTFYAKLPYLSSTLDAQYGPTGEIRTRTGSAAERIFSPVARQTIKEGPAARGADEVVRLSAAPKAPGKYWIGKGGVRVDYAPNERAQIAAAYREATALIGQRLVKDPNYNRLPDDENDPRYTYGMRTKKDVIRNIYSKYRSRVMDQIKPRLEARARKQTMET